MGNTIKLGPAHKLGTGKMMKNLSRAVLVLYAIAGIVSFTSCNKDDIGPNGDQRTFGIFSVLAGDTVIAMNGTINGKTPSDFDKLVKAFPKAKKINMILCPGSEDDEANLLVSKKMHDQGFAFHLFSTSVVASGAVDMYVAGIKRTRELGSKIGVHAWGAGSGEPAATSYPRGHKEHLKYIDYYVSVGFTQKQAEDFYYFTINAASADDIHYMTEMEIETYGLTKG